MSSAWKHDAHVIAMCALCPFKVDDLTDEMGFDNTVLGPALDTDMTGKFRFKEKCNTLHLKAHL